MLTKSRRGTGTHTMEAMDILMEVMGTLMGVMGILMRLRLRDQARRRLRSWEGCVRLARIS